MLEGQIPVTIGGKPRTCRKGDEYYMPAGVPHTAHLKAGARVNDSFDDLDRYHAKRGS